VKVTLDSLYFKRSQVYLNQELFFRNERRKFLFTTSPKEFLEFRTGPKLWVISVIISNKKISFFVFFGSGLHPFLSGDNKDKCINL
jgi:hypothetical protein